VSVLLRFVVPGEPVAWQRTRINRSGYHFTAEKTRTAQATIAEAGGLAFRAAFGLHPLLDEPLSLSIVAFCGTKAKRAHGRYRTTRPDLDNYVKTVMDALNGVIWLDDARIVHIDARKVWAEEPRLSIVVCEPIDYGKVDHGKETRAVTARTENELLPLSTKGGGIRLF
jgi:Holliday junction resolvase RusA-like endonuclease